jgi:hypothetical protein
LAATQKADVVWFMTKTVASTPFYFHAYAECVLR